MKTEEEGYSLCTRCLDTPGHEITDKKGKTYIRLAESDPYYEMTMKNYGLFGKGWTAKTRYVMAQHLGRCLERCECIIHKDRNKDNYAIDNLILRERLVPSEIQEPEYEPEPEELFEDHE